MLEASEAELLGERLARAEAQLAAIQSAQAGSRWAA
jgi:hypothetical protein